MRRNLRLRSDGRGTRQMLKLTFLVLITLSGFNESVQALKETEGTEEVDLLPDDIVLSKPVRIAPKIMPCGTTRTLEPNEEVIIESPNFSQKNNYPNSATCEWKFEFPRRRVILACPNFHLTEFLCFDHVDVFGANGIMHRYCGSSGPKELIISDSATIKFATSAFFGNVGFRCSIVDLDEDKLGTPIPILPITKCSCGTTNDGDRIVNGVETRPNEFPWMGALVRKNGTRPFCGASLINNYYILTAAHCLAGRTPYNLEVLLNLHRTEVGEEGSKPYRRSVEKIILHRSYNSRLDYDVALIKIEEPIDLMTTPPVCLPHGIDLHNPYVGINSTVIGWGLLEEDGALSPVLRKASVTTMSNADCLEKYSSITDRMLCAMSPGVDACQGDSGGPLVYRSSSSKHTQIGIVSWGIGCARPDKPGVYSRITEMMNWITRTASDGIYCDETFP